MRARRWGAAGALGAVVIAVGAAAVAAGGDGDRAAAGKGTSTVATTGIERRDLVETEDVDGTLGFSDERTVTNRLSGTLTWLPEPGDVVAPNHRLYEVDGDPVLLLDGSTPAWRALRAGTSGDDVRELERNLRSAGADSAHAMRIDGTWDAGTTAAVRRWQRRKGLAATGELELGRVVFAPGKRRIASSSATVGEAVSAGATGGTAAADTSGADASSAEAPSSGLMTTTSTRRIVSVALKTSKVALARRGAAVTVELPQGSDVHGTITSVGSVATKPSGNDAEATDATVEVTVRLRGGRGTRGLDQAPVTVRLEQSRRRDVLAIPVTALQAQLGGGWAVEVRDGAARRLVKVTVGATASGYVEINGDGLRPGQRVSNAEV